LEHLFIYLVNSGVVISDTRLRLYRWLWFFRKY